MRAGRGRWQVYLRRGVIGCGRGPRGTPGIFHAGQTNMSRGQGHERRGLERIQAKAIDVELSWRVGGRSRKEAEESDTEDSVARACRIGLRFVMQ
jgi:hypothetical protein